MDIMDILTRFGNFATFYNQNDFEHYLVLEVHETTFWNINVYKLGRKLEAQLAHGKGIEELEKWLEVRGY